MGTKEETARRFLQRIVDLAIGCGAAVLGCVLLTATAFHLIASAGSSAPETRVSLVAPAPARVVHDLPHVVMRHHAVMRIARSHVAIRPRSVRAPARAPLEHHVASAIAAQRPRAPKSHRTTQLATVERRPPIRSRPDRPRVLQVALRGDAFVSYPPRRFVATSRPVRRSHRPGAAPRPKTPARFEILPPLIGVSGIVAAMPRLEGMRMRGRVVVPTPAPTASIAPISRAGLSPGP